VPIAKAAMIAQFRGWSISGLAKEHLTECPSR